jgi:glycine/D-amino acid oxidase-like deaminating enzyme
MAELKADILVLGAGMVGVGAALRLQRRGRDVILVDRHERAGEETSFGNAGLIECASVFPYMFPAISGRAVVRFRPSAPWSDAGPGDRPPAGGNHDRRDAVRRSPALRRRAFRLTISADWRLTPPPRPLRQLASCRLS